MKIIKPLFVIATLLGAVGGAAQANDSESDARVRATLSERLVLGQPQPVNHAMTSDSDSGMSIAASRVQESLSAGVNRDSNRDLAVDAADFVNDAGKSVPATRIEHALSQSV